jgi:hypothetical protein
MVLPGQELEFQVLHQEVMAGMELNLVPALLQDSASLEKGVSLQHLGPELRVLSEQPKG